MRCPHDLRPQDFKDALKSVPRGFVLRKTKRFLWWRDLYFDVMRKPFGTDFKVGDVFVTSVAVKSVPRGFK